MVTIILCENRVIDIFAITSVINGVLLCVVNGNPNYKKISNDGSTIRLLHRHPEYIKYFYMVLNVMDEMKEGKTWADYEPEEFEKARAVLRELMPYKEQLETYHANIITLEALFLELITDNDSKKVEELYDENVHEYIREMKSEHSIWRIRMAYEWFQEHDRVAAMMCYDRIYESEQEVLCPGEIELERMLADDIKQRMEQTEVLHFPQNQVSL